jgi:hypothetical protein
VIPGDVISLEYIAWADISHRRQAMKQTVNTKSA